MPDNANEYQIGGTHYRSSYIHWDYVADTGMNYFEGNATKYVARWRKKNGFQDLQKGLHYLNKLEELVLAGKVKQIDFSYPDRIKATADFAQANDLGSVERSFMLAVAVWQEIEDLQAARTFIFSLLDEAERLGGTPIPPFLSDENKQARSEDEK